MNVEMVQIIKNIIIGGLWNNGLAVAGLVLAEAIAAAIRPVQNLRRAPVDVLYNLEGYATPSRAGSKM